MSDSSKAFRNTGRAGAQNAPGDSVAAAPEEFSVWELVREAWHMGLDCQAAALRCWLLFISVAVALTALFTVLGGGFPRGGMEGYSAFPGFLDEMIQTIILLPMAAGLWIVGIGFARGNRPRARSLFAWYDFVLKLLLINIFVHILVVIGLALLVLPGIYLAICLQFAIPLAVDKHIGPVEAIRRSWQVVHRCWFRMLLLNSIAVLSIFGSLLLLGIPLLWVLPAILVGRGILYEKLVGVENETLRRLSYRPLPGGFRRESVED